MDQRTRLANATMRLATATNVIRTRAYDAARMQRNGRSQEERLEDALVLLEKAADEVWRALENESTLKAA